MTKFSIKGDLVFTARSDSFNSFPDSYLLCEDGKYCGIVQTLNGDWRNAPLYDYSGKLVIPGFTDLHLHAPQFTFCGMGMDLPLLDWLNTYTFPEEAKYVDAEYARKNYMFFASALARSATVNAAVFGTIHTESDLILASLLEKTGLRIFMGKVNMDRNSLPALTENTDDSVSNTELFIRRSEEFRNVRPAVTPRFVPSCTPELMSALGKIAEKYDLPVQSHLDENTDEIAWVKKLHPDCPDYASVYEKYGLLNDRTIMAHCVYLNEHEQLLMKRTGAFIAHCPQSNTNLCSGVAPVVKYMDAGIRMGLGTDVAAGSSINMFRAASDAVQVSKLRSSLLHDTRPLTVSEAFYLGTKGGGAFFGKTGSFEEKYSADAVVVDDSGFGSRRDLTPVQRVERILYLADFHAVCAKFIMGERVYEKS